jgi:FKBP-type peptidyl-prolyl cis-trans isomerase/DnaJ domain
VSYQRDYYAILQVPRNASQEDIERAYKRLSERYDPTTSRKLRAEQRHAQITEAYEVLSDRGRRRAYDRELARGSAAPGSLMPSDVLSNRFMIVAGAIIVVSVLVILGAVLLLADGDDEEAAASVTPTAATETPFPTPTGPTPTDAPATPPEVTGETITTESGLQYIVLQEGTGATPAATDEVQIWYTGWLQADGMKFDSAVDRGAPAVFGVGGVVPGFSEALQLMQEGGRLRAIIPPELGYGEAGSPPSIPANATLVFDIELITVIPGASPSPTATPAPATDTGAASPQDTATAAP